MNFTGVKNHNAMLAIIRNLPGNYLIVLPNAPTFTIVEISEAYNEATYTRREDILGKGIFEVFPNVPGDELADGEQNLTASFNNVIATHQNHEMLVQRYPVRIPGSDVFVERFWLTINKPVIIDGQLHYIIHSITDVTESKLLKSREQYFKALADESPFMILRFAGASCLYANTAWMQTTGLSFEESIGLGYLKALHPDDVEHEKDLFNQAVKTNGSFESKFRIVNKLNETRWLTVKVLPLHTDGSITEFVASLIDITEQEIANQRIRQSEMLLRQLADSIIQMVWVTDAEGMHEYYNKRWYDFTGIAYGESDGEGWNAVFHPEDQQRAWNVWRHSLATGTPYEIEYRLRKFTGEYIWVLGRAAPYFDEHGKIIKWFGTCTDIHEQKLLQHQKDDFINIASHELKTPLTSLSANMQFIERSLLRNRPDDHVLISMISSCFKNVKKLNKIIADLVDANSIGLGELLIKKERFDIIKLLQDVTSNINIGTSTIEIVGKSSLMVNADAGKIEQVVVNLVNNACKYAGESEVIMVKATLDDEYAKVAITDQGKGIQEDKIKYLFDRYYRADTANMKYSGMGLGLYVCANIIRSHGGSIGVESKVGNGSTFWFTLPI
ncbi:PAS domain-containing sensor histidine kinase [uncultured Mucilaginibacter sp.]|uniref:PAS domain-containing sensor histidine kinase n=1 Tax=uncultured Mucilaginibacter sp. TaxID=797541 RepID=UPI0025F70FEE|nr:PAS domain-containing sensor histidine kinase [uncultured Mucilaginibacter sp.]